MTILEERALKLALNTVHLQAHIQSAASTHLDSRSAYSGKVLHIAAEVEEQHRLKRQFARACIENVITASKSKFELSEPLRASW